MSKKVLLVDDEEGVIDGLRRFLVFNGYEVYTAMNGEEGLHQVKNIMPDIIVSDIQMPIMDGYTFLKKLQYDALISPIPVIMLTAKGGLEDLCVLEGASHFLEKPIDTTELLMTIEKILS